MGFRQEKNKNSKICMLISIHFVDIKQSRPFPHRKVTLRKSKRVYNSLQSKCQHILIRWEGSCFTELTLIISVLNSNEKNLYVDFYLLWQ